MTDCLFCAIVAGEVPATMVHESERCVAFLDINPAAPVHVLVVPRRHIENASVLTHEDGDDLAALFVAAQKVAKDAGIAEPDRGYRLIMNVGPDALNSVAHLHLHVLGGTKLNWQHA